MGAHTTAAILLALLALIGLRVGDPLAAAGFAVLAAALWLRASRSAPGRRRLSAACLVAGALLLAAAALARANIVGVRWIPPLRAERPSRAG